MSGVIHPPRDVERGSNETWSKSVKMLVGAKKREHVSPENFRLIAIIATLFVSLVGLMNAGAMHAKIKRLATVTPTTATVIRAWREVHKNTFDYAHITFDRKENDGHVVHCDLPKADVTRFGRTFAAGDTMLVAPRPMTCWEPDAICENCQPDEHDVFAVLKMAAIAGLLCCYLIWSALRGRAKNEALQ